MERMKERLSPIFSDITWGAGGSTADLTLELAANMQKTGHLVNMHMTCTNIVGETDPKGSILKGLQTAIVGSGISNIVALRGDPPAGQETWTAVEGGFECALDLVKFIRDQPDFTTTVGISVAGYPEGHPNVIKLVEGDITSLSESEQTRVSTFDNGATYYVCNDEDYAKEIAYLKEKIDAGGDFIITQMFFDASLYHKFVNDCRAAGILCPIVPGIMCINNYPGFVKMSQFCKTRVPDHVRSKMEELKDADMKSVQQYGIEFGAQLCQDLISGGSEPAPVLHFYTLNLEKVVYGVLQKIGLMKVDAPIEEE
jgi:methylenetetrahydrofolate reductase (NADPH)